MDGFKALRGMNGPQKFNIHRCDAAEQPDDRHDGVGRCGDKKRLPSSHTCFNQLDLPEYSSEEEVKCRASVRWSSEVLPALQVPPERRTRRFRGLR
eukprot:747949-Hanusia_phi.AAC.2